MKIYNESNHLICDSEENKEKFLELSQTGHLNIKQIIVKHHDAIIATEEQTIFKPSMVYFTDGTSQKISEEDPHIQYDDEGYPVWHNLPDDEHLYFGMDIVQEIVKEGSPAKPAWDETEDIFIYVPFTEEELLNQQKDQENIEFLDHAASYYKVIKEVGEETSKQLNEIAELKRQLGELNLATAEIIEENISVKDKSYQELINTVNSISDKADMLILALAEMAGVE